MLNAADLASMRAEYEGIMMDSGKVQVFSSTINSFGESVGTYTDQSEISCGIEMKPGSETVRNTATVLKYDAVVRLPIATVVTEKDHFKLTKRYGETLSTPIVYEIVSPPQKGPAGIRLLLQEVTV